MNNKIITVKFDQGFSLTLMQMFQNIYHHEPVNSFHNLHFYLQESFDYFDNYLTNLQHAPLYYLRILHKLLIHNMVQNIYSCYGDPVK